MMLCFAQYKFKYVSEVQLNDNLVEGQFQGLQ